jgi:hypothetical protein
MSHLRSPFMRKFKQKIGKTWRKGKKTYAKSFPFTRVQTPCFDLNNRAANKPGDLRSRLSTKKVKPVEPLNEKFYINPSPLKKVANLQFTIKRVSPPIQKKIENNIQNANLSFNITRTVKNEQARNPNSLIIDTRDSSEEEENQNQVKVIPKIVQSLHSKQTAKKRRSR